MTPGFTVKDVNGERWFLKFDPPGYRAMSTGTEVAVTKLMWALGYNVPENHIAYMRAEQLAVGDGATFTPPEGKRRAMRAADVDDLLERANQESDGSYRVVASRALPGKPVGRLRFYGTRPDDPNDIVPHENRRELRGYGVFAAWVNHVDAKSINSLDTLVTENGRAHVRHNLIDFGSALGSGGVGPADFWAGEEYLVEPASVGKRLVGFGFSFPKWHTDPYYESPSIGRLPEDNTDFDPDAWKPRVRNRAFLNARLDDKFWAARKLAALSTPLLRAAVRAGDFGDPAAEDFLVRALAQRRDAIARAYLTAVNPILDPRLDGGILTFTNAAVDADVARAPRSYRASWSTYDNATGETGRIGETSGATTSLSAPADLPSHDGVFIKVQLSAVVAADLQVRRSHGKSPWMHISASAEDSGDLWASSGCRKDNDDERLNGQDVVHVRDSGGRDGGQCGTGGCAGHESGNVAVRGGANHRKPVQRNRQRPETTPIAQLTWHRDDWCCRGFWRSLGGHAHEPRLFG